MNIHNKLRQYMRRYMIFPNGFINTRTYGFNVYEEINRGFVQDFVDLQTENLIKILEIDYFGVDSKEAHVTISLTDLGKSILTMDML